MKTKKEERAKLVQFLKNINARGCAVEDICNDLDDAIGLLEEAEMQLKCTCSTCLCKNCEVNRKISKLLVRIT